jgi:hypothetical protein
MYTPMFQIHTSVWPSEVKSNQEYLSKDSSHQFYALPEGEYYNKNYNPTLTEIFIVSSFYHDSILDPRSWSREEVFVWL